MDSLTKEELQEVISDIGVQIGEEATDIVKDIKKDNNLTNNYLQDIESDLQDINENIILLLPNEVKDDEQETKEITGEKKEEIKNTKSGETTNEESITIETIHNDIQELNDNITLNNQIQVGQILFMGVIVGVLLFKIMWDRLRK